jgi:hypothetical protein
MAGAVDVGQVQSHGGTLGNLSGARPTRLHPPSFEPQMSFTIAAPQCPALKLGFASGIEPP